MGYSIFLSIHGGGRTSPEGIESKNFQGVIRKNKEFPGPNNMGRF